MDKLSAFIIAKNEENRISRAILSVKKIAQEVIVVDSGSTDKTVEIATSLGAKVYFNEWPGYSQQKSFAESLCENDWVINIDADEELSDDLQDEIHYIFQSPTLLKKYLGYRINIVILHRKDDRPRRFAPSNSYIRLYNRKFISFANSLEYTTRDIVGFNEGVDEKDSVYMLDGVMYHRSGISIKQLVDKANFYSGEQALDLVNNKKHISNLRLILEFPLYFFKAYIKRRYFVFGMDGFIDSIIFAFARFLRLAKFRELEAKSKENTK